MLPKELDLQLKDLYEDIKKQYIDKGKTVHDFVRDYEDLRPHILSRWQTKKTTEQSLEKEEIDEFLRRFSIALEKAENLQRILQDFLFFCFFDIDFVSLLFEFAGFSFDGQNQKKGKVFFALYGRSMFVHFGFGIVFCILLSFAAAKRADKSMWERLTKDQGEIGTRKRNALEKHFWFAPYHVLFSFFFSGLSEFPLRCYF